MRSLSLSLSLSHNQLINSQGLHLLILSHWGLGFYHINLGGHKYSVYSKEGILSPEYPGPGTEGEGLRLWAGSPPWPIGFLALGEEHSGTQAGAGPSKAQHPGWGKDVVPSSPPCLQTLTDFRADRETRDEAVWQRHRAVSGKATFKNEVNFCLLYLSIP